MNTTTPSRRELFDRIQALALQMHEIAQQAGNLKSIVQNPTAFIIHKDSLDEWQQQYNALESALTQIQELQQVHVDMQTYIQYHQRRFQQAEDALPEVLKVVQGIDPHATALVVNSNQTAQTVLLGLDPEVADQATIAVVAPSSEAALTIKNAVLGEDSTLTTPLQLVTEIEAVHGTYWMFAQLEDVDQ